MAPTTATTPKHIKRESSPQWPQTSFSALDRRDRSSTPNVARKRQRQESRHSLLSPDGDDSDSNIFCVDRSPKDPSEALIEMAIGHMLVDGPAHPFYNKHVKTVILASRSSADGLKVAVERLQDSATKLDLVSNAPAAIGALTIAWYDSELSGRAPWAPRFSRASAETDSMFQDDVGSGVPTEGSAPAVKTEDDNDDRLIAKGVDMFWYIDAMKYLLPDLLKAAVESTFKDTQTLYMVNWVAQQEFAYYLNMQPFDLDDAIKDATIAWALLRTAIRQQWGARLHKLHSGDIYVFDSPEPGHGYAGQLHRYVEIRGRLSACAAVTFALELQAQANGELPTAETAIGSSASAASQEHTARAASTAAPPKKKPKRSKHKRAKSEKKTKPEHDASNDGWRRRTVFLRRDETKYKVVRKKVQNAFNKDGLSQVQDGPGGYYIVFDDRASAEAAAKRGVHFAGKQHDLVLGRNRGR
ncbi:hypothetical protein LTR86_005174 [Recurvomyces mirabilis]|nr:hypothetical protein LTR86_005174 [Recurvomyces mirabilis]